MWGRNMVLRPDNRLVFRSREIKRKFQYMAYQSKRMQNVPFMSAAQKLVVI